MSVYWPDEETETIKQNAMSKTPGHQEEFGFLKYNKDTRTEEALFPLLSTPPLCPPSL